MGNIRRQTKTKFIIFATVAVEINNIMVFAKDISLAASNAKAIAFRAGEKARGFQPITEFINELAKETLALVHEINNNALSVYKIAIKEYRLKQAQLALENTTSLANDSAVFLESMQHRRITLNKEMKSCQIELTLKVEQLTRQLNDIVHPARAARVIAANSRIEASQADEYLQSLQGVAESVENAAQVIYDNVQSCHSALAMIHYAE